MRMLLFNRLGLASPPAHGANALLTCAALSRLGLSVVIHADLEGRSEGTLLERMGVAPISGLHFRQMSWQYHARILPWLLPRFLREPTAEPVVVAVNEIRNYVPALLDAARRRRFLIAYEAHNAAGQLALDRAGGRAWAARKAASRIDLERRILSQVDVVLSPNPRTLDAIRPMLRDGAVCRVAPNGARLPEGAAPVAKDIDLIYAGSLQKWKGADALVGALSLLAPYRLTVLARASEQDRLRLQTFAVRAGCASRLDILPSVPYATVPSYYARTRVGVVTLEPASLEAREFTCPIKLMEMMAAGIAIVAPDLPSIREFVVDGKEALLVTCGDDRAMAAAARRLLEDRPLANRLGSAARARARSHSFESRALLFRDAFEDGLEQLKRPPGPGRRGPLP